MTVSFAVQAMEYMVNCKYCDASDKAGHPVVFHCVILVSVCPHAFVSHLQHVPGTLHFDKMYSLIVMIILLH